MTFSSGRKQNSVRVPTGTKAVVVIVWYPYSTDFGSGSGSGAGAGAGFGIVSGAGTGGGGDGNNPAAFTDDCDTGTCIGRATGDINGKNVIPTNGGTGQKLYVQD